MDRKTPRFKIGDAVSCDGHVVIAYDDSTRILLRKKLDFDGVIVGAAYRFGGKIKGGESRTSIWRDIVDSQPTLVRTKGHLVWQVRTSLMGKIYDVFDHDVRLNIKYLTWFAPPLPFKLGHKWCDSDKDDKRDIMKNFKRDKRGRWVKGGSK